MAAQPKQGDGGEARQRARAHFVAGAEHYGQRRFRQAIREFRLAADVMPSAELWFDIARAYEALGEHGPAIEHYELYLRDRVDAPDVEEVRARIDDLQRAQRAVAQARSSPALLRIDVDRDDAVVMLDARSVGRSPLPKLLEVEPGRHRLEVTHPKHLPFRAELDVQTGSLTAAFVELTPREQRRGQGDRPRTWTWIAGAAGAASLIASGAFGALAIASRDDGDLATARDRAQASDALLGGALALGIATLVLYQVEGGQHEAR